MLIVEVMGATTTGHRTGAIPTDLDPYGREFLAEPLRFEEQLREAGPLLWLPRYGAYAMARYDDVHGALNDHETFISGRGVGIFVDPDDTPPNILISDDPLHAQLRRVHNKALNPGFIRSLRASFRESAEQVLTPLIGAGRIDAISDIAVAFPLTVFPDMVGVRPDGRDHLLMSAAFTFNSFGPQNWLWHETIEDGQRGMAWLWDQTAPGETSGGVGERIHEIARESGLDPEQARGLVAGLLIPGLDTTMHALGLAFYFLATHPDQWRLLKADPSRARAAFEEAIRLGSPVASFARHTTVDVRISDGVTLPADSQVVLFLGAANRDPRHWRDPMQYDITRTTSGHVGFGSGIHSCSGQNVARMEGETVLATLAERASALSLVGEPEYELSNALRGFKSLPIRIDA